MARSVLIQRTLIGNRMHNRHIVIFDGVCNFCNGAVNFIIKRDPTGRFAFAPLQSPVGQELLEKHGMAMVDEDTVLVFGAIISASDQLQPVRRDETNTSLDGAFFPYFRSSNDPPTYIGKRKVTKLVRRGSRVCHRRRRRFHGLTGPGLE